jgi:hypothetical protein
MPRSAVLAQPQESKSGPGGRILGRDGQRTPGGKQDTAAGISRVDDTAGEVGEAFDAGQAGKVEAGPRDTKPDVFGDEFAR